MESDTHVAPPDPGEHESFADEMQEDLLMLKAHMGHFDHLLDQAGAETHLFEPSPLHQRASQEKFYKRMPNTPMSRRMDVTRDEESSDEEEIEKGSSKKRKAPSRRLDTEYDSDISNEEEDLEEMKMRRHVEEESHEQRKGDMSPPPAKRSCPPLFSPHEHQTLSLSAPTTPMPSMLTKPILANNGRYYDDVQMPQERKCRFCLRANGLAFKAPPASRISCFVCGGEHVARECPNVLCYNCWEIGHRSQACTQPRAPRAACFRCRGHHDASDCPSIQGIQRRGSQESINASNVIDLINDSPKDSKKSRKAPKEVSLPSYCCNCGLSGHVARDCRRPNLESTQAAIDRDSRAWYERLMAEFMERQRQKSNQNSDKRHHQHHNKKEQHISHQHKEHSHQNKKHQSPAQHQNQQKANNSVKRTVSLPSTPQNARANNFNHRMNEQKHSKSASKPSKPQSNRSQSNAPARRVSINSR